MKKEVAEKIVRGITDKIECNTVDIDDWAEFWGFTREEYEEFLDMAIKALEQEPCEDCISRQAVLDCLTATGLKKFDFILDARDKIKNLPPVTQPKTGHWMKSNIGGAKVCSVCNAHMGLSSFKFCPNCGAKMESEVEL